MTTPSLPEPARTLPLRPPLDVLVCGGGPAGVAAALAAARAGARTALVELHGCLGGVWTAGLLSVIIDHRDKGGIMAELSAGLAEAGAGGPLGNEGRYDPEGMKLLLERLCLEAGVQVRLLTRVCAAPVEAGRIAAVVTESKSGREAWQARVYIDCTGDGDLAAQAGCSFEMGRPGSGACQPASLMGVLDGLEADAVAPFICRMPNPQAKKRLLEELRRAGHEPSYGQPSLFRIHDRLFALMANHQYGVRADDADGLSAASLAARAEVHRLVAGLRQLGGPWAGIRLVTTGAQLGIREGRRVRGLHTVTVDELVAGVRHPDAVCRATFCVDVHATDPAQGTGYGAEGVRSKPYDIPLRALIASERSNLLLAGRCISGDFLAHASYRVTGNAVALGEAAGICAALAARQGILPRELPFDLVKALLPPLPA